MNYRTSMANAPNFGEPIEEPVVMGLAVAFKALVLRNGGHVAFTNEELEQARTVLMRVEGTEELLTIETLDGEAPDQPRYDADYNPGD